MVGGGPGARSLTRRILPRLARAIALIALAAAVYGLKASKKMPDFEVYWKAGVRARAAQPLYRAEDGHYQHKYLPAFAVFAIPIGALPLPVARAVWFACSVGLVAALVALSLRLLPERRKPAWLLVLIAVLGMGKFYGHEIVLGQVNVLLGVLVAAAVLLLRSGREAPAGGLVALAVIVKPYAILFLPWLCARGRPASIVAAGAGTGLALVVPALLYGFEGNVALHRDWWATVTQSTAPNLLNPDNVSVAAMYARWMGPGGRAMAAAVVTAGVLLLMACWVFVRRGGVPFPEGLESALLLTLIPLLSPQGWDYVLLLATPAVVCLANYDRSLPWAIRLGTLAAIAIAGLSLFDIMGRASYSAFMRLSIITFCYLTVAVALCALRLRKAA